MKYKVVKKLTDKGFPTHSKGYPASHEKADRVEKRASPRAYKEVNKLERKIGKHELLGKNTRSGKIEVSSKVPKRDRANIALHEKTENKQLQKCGYCGKSPCKCK